jgi:hypothetical protein
VPRASQSARELVRQRLAEQGAAAALEALCPEFAERLLPRLLPGDAVPSLIEARVSAPDAARQHDAGFVRASWGAVPPGLLSPLRGTARPGAGAAPPPASPAAFAAQLSALVQAGEWDVADMLTDNRGILVATLWADVLLLSRAVASGVAGRIASAALSPAAAAAEPGAAPCTPPAPQAPSAFAAAAGPAPAFTLDDAAMEVPPAPDAEEELEEAPSPSAARSAAATPAPSEAESEGTPVPEEAAAEELPEPEGADADE